MLDALAAIFGDASLLVTYNGRTFDVPVMEMRWAFHRSRRRPASCRTSTCCRRRAGSGATGDCDGGRALQRSARARARRHRIGDVPGFEIPTRYFQFLRTGDAGVIEGVLEHNRHDLVSLAVVTSHALALARGGPDACRSAAEQLALARLYERAEDRGARGRARTRCASNAGDRAMCDGRRWPGWPCFAAASAASMRPRQRGRTCSRSRRPMTPTRLGRRAAEALAIHHEHRARDLDTARRYAETLGADASGRAADEARHRLDRLNRKLSNRAKRDKALDGF